MFQKRVRIYNAGLTAVKNPDRFNVHEYLNFYIDLMEKYNKGDTDDHHDPTDLVLAVVGHDPFFKVSKKTKEWKNLLPHGLRFLG